MSSPSPHSADKPILLLAGLGTLCLAAAQAIMPFSHALGRASDGPGERSTLLLFASSFAVAGILVLIALYLFSEAGLMRRLPFLRLVLAVAGAGFIYHGMWLPLQVAGALGHGPFAGDVAWVGVVSSAVALDLGIGYLICLALLWPTVRLRRPVGP